VRLIVIAVVVALAAASCGGGHGSGSSPTSGPAVNATHAELLPTDVYELPDFTFARFHQLLTQLRGTPVVVNVWGSWCAPCREEGPRLAAAARKYGHDVQFIGVDVQDTKDGGRGFIRDMGWTYPSVFDPTPQGDIYVQLGYLGVPDTIFYDAAGRKLDDHSGPISASQLEEGIHKITE